MVEEHMRAFTEIDYEAAAKALHEVRNDAGEGLGLNRIDWDALEEDERQFLIEDAQIQVDAALGGEIELREEPSIMVQDQRRWVSEWEAHDD